MTVEDIIKEKRNLEALTLTFLLELKEAAKQESTEGIEAEYWKDRFMKHFNIIANRQGKIDKT